MKYWTSMLLALCMVMISRAQSPVGKWKIVSHTITFEGKKMDLHAALLLQRPCAGKIVYEINANKTYRLNASASGCDDGYKNIQEKLYGKTKWKLEDNVFTISATDFVAGQSYIVAFAGNRMTMTGTGGQGVVVYERL